MLRRGGVLPVKNTGAVRPNWKNIIPVAAVFLLFAVLGVLAWDRSDPHFDLLIVLFLSFLLALLVYQLLYMKNWRITLSESTVELRNIFGRKKKFARENVRWTTSVSGLHRAIQIILHDYAAKEPLARVSLDCINVNLLFTLPHYGPMTPEDKSAYFCFAVKKN